MAVAVNCLVTDPRRNTVCGVFGTASSMFAMPKPLLLAALGDLLPSETWDRPKMGFTLPFAPWLRRRAPELRARSLEGGCLGRKAVERVWDGFEAGRLHWSRAWALVVLARFAAGRDKAAA